MSRSTELVAPATVAKPRQDRLAALDVYLRRRARLRRCLCWAMSSQWGADDGGGCGECDACSILRPWDN